MKKLFCHIAAAVTVLSAALSTETAGAQETMADAIKAGIEKTKYSFSAEGRKAWKPEFTARNYSGFVTGGPFITGGVRISDRRTLGLALWQGDTYVDAVPGDFYSVSAGLYTRRYFHLGSRDIVAFYSDLAVGGGYIYRVTGGCYNTQTGEVYSEMDENPGDMFLAFFWQPGIRFRIWRNLHIFLGPAIGTYTVGAHLGFGL